MKRFALVLFLLGLLVFLTTACFPSSKQAKKTKTSSIKTQVWTDKSFSTKQTYEAKGLRVTINNARKATKESGLMMPTLTSGGEGIWIVVNLTVKNTSSESKDETTVDLAIPMKIIDSAGNEFTADGDLLSAEQRQQMEEPLLFEEIGKLTPGENKRLAPGQEVTGNIWFSVSDKSTGLKLQRSVPLEEKLVWPLEQ